jgi:hypothetical protein
MSRLTLDVLRALLVRSAKALISIRRRITMNRLSWLYGATLTALLCITAPAIGKTFAGHECTDDCSGHIAGYQWAEEHNVSDPEDCDGNSLSFIEGCQAYARGESPDIEDDEDDPPTG